MFNDDPYSRQRGKTQQGMVGGAPVVTRPPGAPITNPMQPQTPAPATPVLQRPIAPRAPLAGVSIGPDRSTGAGASGTWPPRPMAPGSAIARPPGAPITPMPSAPTTLTRTAFNPAATSSAFNAPQQTPGFATPKPEMVHPVPTGFGKGVQPSKNGYDPFRGLQSPSQPVPAASFDMTKPPATPSGIVSPDGTPGPAFTGGAAQPLAQDRTLLGPMRRQPQQGEVGRSQSGRQLPGAPTVGANGEVVYDDAFMKRNPDLIKAYENTNVVQAGPVPPGVAATMAGGQTPQLGALSRPPRGFTAADRAEQLDNIDRQGREYRVRALTEQATRAAQYGDMAKAAALNEQARTASIAEPPRIGPMTRPDPNDAARLSIEQQQAAVQNEQTQVQTQGDRVKNQQAQQLAGLQQQLLSGTPEQKQQAAAALATVQGTKPGQPLRVSRQVPIGTDAMGVQQFRKEDGVYDHSTGQVQWMGGDQKAALPSGYTEAQAIAEAQKAIEAKPDAAPAIRAELAKYGLTLPGA